MRVGWLVLNIMLCILAGSHALPAGAAAPESSDGERLTVNAIFQSRRGGMVLIDGIAYRPGDRVRGAEILAIEQGAVRLRTGDGEYTAWVGFDLADSFTPLPEAPAAPEPVWVAAAPESPKATTTVTLPSDTETGIHEVAYGETLSTIAARYRPAGVALNKVISALLEANSRTIGDDIHRIYAGSRLRIPEFAARDDAQHLLADASPALVTATAPATAMSPNRPEPVPEPPSDAAEINDFVAVLAGDTLSGIAHRLKVPGMSNEQLMQALYDANPGAFGGSMDLLFAGETLRVPAAIRLPADEARTDKVLALLDR